MSSREIIVIEDFREDANVERIPEESLRLCAQAVVTEACARRSGGCGEDSPRCLSGISVSIEPSEDNTHLFVAGMGEASCSLQRRRVLTGSFGIDPSSPHSPVEGREGWFTDTLTANVTIHTEKYPGAIDEYTQATGSLDS